MSKRGHIINQKEQARELLSYFDCNNNKIYNVSRHEPVKTNSPESTYYTDPIYQIDPITSTTYTVKKKAGRYWLTPNLIIWDDVTSMFKRIGSDSNFILNVRETHCIIEFDVYMSSTTTNRVIYNDGDVNISGGANGRNGVGLWVYSSNITLRWANNSTTATNQIITNLSNVSNKWNHVVVEYIPLSDRCKIDFVITNSTESYNGTVIVNNTESDSRWTMLAGSHWAYHAGAEDTVDFFKEIKIWKYNE